MLEVTDGRMYRYLVSESVDDVIENQWRAIVTYLQHGSVTSPTDLSRIHILDESFVPGQSMWWSLSLLFVVDAYWSNITSSLYDNNIAVLGPNGATKL